MYSLEYIVDFSVPAATICPCLDDPDIVSENLEMKVGGAGGENCLNEQLESDALGPAKVAPIPLPSRFEVPSVPSVADRDANTHGGTCIRESPEVEDGLESGNGDGRDGRGR